MTLDKIISFNRLVYPIKTDLKVLLLSKYPLTTKKNQLSCFPTASEGVTGTVSRRSDQHKYLTSFDNLFEDNLNNWQVY